MLNTMICFGQNSKIGQNVLKPKQLLKPVLIHDVFKIHVCLLNMSVLLMQYIGILRQVTPSHGLTV